MVSDPLAILLCQRTVPDPAFSEFGQEPKPLARLRMNNRDKARIGFFTQLERSATNLL